MAPRLELVASFLLVATSIGCKSSAKSSVGSGLTVSGGDDASSGQFPGAVKLPTVACSGAKIGVRFVLTAGHCVTTFDAAGVPVLNMAAGAKLKYYVGLDSSSDGERNDTVRAVHTHPQWFEVLRIVEAPLPPRQRMFKASSELGAIDLAIIELEEERSDPIATFSFEPVAAGARVLMTGFGAESILGGGRGVLKFAPKTVAKVLPTALLLPPEDPDAPDSVSDRAMAAPGDSGGPMYVTGPAGEMQVAGVNSWNLNNKNAPPADLPADQFEAFVRGPSHVMRLDDGSGTPGVATWLRKIVFPN